MELDDVRAFIKVAELASFSRAGEQLGSAKSRVSSRVALLEAELGSRLLVRSTRVVRLTPDGEQFLARARRWVLDADELSAMFQTPSHLRGRLRVDLPVSLARDVVIPRLPEFLAAHPQLEVMLSATDRQVDLVREGFDCVVRVGNVVDSALMVRRLGAFATVNCASPAYLLKYGTPRTLEELDQHLMVHYSPRLGTRQADFEYWDGERYRRRPMRSAIAVNNVDAYRAACLAGLGIIQCPRYGLRASLASGELVEVLPELPAEPMPVSLMHTRNVPKRVRAVMSWLAGLIEPLLGRSAVRLRDAEAQGT
ncbi:MAG TPA: LysR substrate-binding domain-containing protein [Polyangiales bacterium]